MAFAKAFRNKRVLVTGHTGFKGSWLCEWLLALQAEVTGFALAPPTQPALFEQLALAGRLRHVTGDVRDFTAVRKVVGDSRPDFVFHLAAQPLVRLSYDQPVETYGTNIMGVVHVLEALRALAQPCVAVIVTSDKCYENREQIHSYREEDPMGGHDPYSSSKGAAELVVNGYRCSYFSAPGSPVRVASARAGNVIGGGDWAKDRIMPDCVRALQRGESIRVRNRDATRPWQHVLEPLSGYLALAGAMARPGDPHGADYASAFNFGPGQEANRTVGELVGEVLRHWPGRVEEQSDPRAPHEAKLLSLAIDKARHHLRWEPVWNFERAVAETVAWYRQAAEGGPPAVEFTRRQIAGYVADARTKSIPWAA